MLKFMILSAAVLLTSCSQSQKSKSDQEISLKADRSYLAQERADIPEGLQEENDFLALVLKDMAQVKMPPPQVRDRFYKEVRKVRDNHNKIQRKKRDVYNKDERTARDEFLNKLKSERESFVKRKRDREESQEFFQKQNNERNAFFETQRDKRKDFESQMEEIRNGFNEEINLRQRTFDDAFRDYQKRYQDYEKEKKTAAPASSRAYQSAPQPSPVQQQPGMPAQEQYPGQFKDLEDLNK